jgi:1-acyl-sn-glycerol-3-phosphate acyltransferase
MYNYIKNNDKIILIILPEGNSIKKNSHNNLNQKNISNFNISHNKNCFNYKKGAFIMSLMSNIPVLHGIFYSPLPDYKYTINYNNQKLEHNIKHINHSGIKIYKPEIYSEKIPFTKELTDENILSYIDENNVHIEKYRSIMEQKYVNRYFETLEESHKYNF